MANLFDMVRTELKAETKNKVITNIGGFQVTKDDDAI